MENNETTERGEQPSPILDSLAITVRKIEKSLTDKKWYELTDEDKKRKKFNRAFQRFMLGRSFQGEYRLLTLTTPEDYKGDIHQAWRKFVNRMCRRGMPREYYVVKEWNEKHTCEHLHVVLRLDYIGYMVARQQWQAVTGAVWIHVDKVYSIKGMAGYLAKYLVKGCQETRKRSYWCSYGWIYRKWRTFSRDMYELGVKITTCEHELIHGLKNHEERVNYLNWRLQGATLKSIRNGEQPRSLVVY
jgi:hypothetical protein